MATTYDNGKLICDDRIVYMPMPNMCRKKVLKNIFTVVRKMIIGTFVTAVIYFLLMMFGHIFKKYKCGYQIGANGLSDGQPEMCFSNTVITGIVLLILFFMIIVPVVAMYVVYFWVYAIATITKGVRKNVETNGDEFKGVCVFDKSVKEGAVFYHIASKDDVFKLKLIFSLSFFTGVIWALFGHFYISMLWAVLMPILADFVYVSMFTIMSETEKMK